MCLFAGAGRTESRPTGLNVPVGGLTEAAALSLLWIFVAPGNLKVSAFNCPETF